MQIMRDVPALRQALAGLRTGGGRVALVPTMGALHAGHLKLVAEARARADHVVASIFVNPRQFGPREDLASYPRREAEDAGLLRVAGCALLWAPTVDAMYPPGSATTVSVSGVSEGLCGGDRPGHFDGVATVVAKLFNQVRPDLALFGEKDWQQLSVVRRMAADLDLGVEVVGVPTVREADGLAMSSRNAYLTAAEREAARALPEALAWGRGALEGGGTASAVADAVAARLLGAGFARVDYVELRDAETLAALERATRPGRLLAAARIGAARLIDNMAVAPIASR